MTTTSDQDLGVSTDPALHNLIRLAVERVMSDDEVHAQRVSWIVGQTGISSDVVAAYLRKQKGVIRPMPGRTDGSPDCECMDCSRTKGKAIEGIRLDALQLILCGVCGNKCCPQAADHRASCTGSHQPGQPAIVPPFDDGTSPVTGDPDLPKPLKHAHPSDAGRGERRAASEERRIEAGHRKIGPKVLNEREARELERLQVAWGTNIRDTIGRAILEAARGLPEPEASIAEPTGEA